ncbi:MAG: transglycosylase SLT domain-containing protein [Gemmatimonadota bacterium]
MGCSHLLEADDSGEEQASGLPEGPDPVGELLMVPPLDSTTQESLLVLVDSVREAFGQEQWSAALDGYRRLGAAAPVLADWLPVLQGEALAHAGDPAGVQESLGTHVPAVATEGTGESWALHPNPVTRKWGWKLTVDALDRSGQETLAAEAAMRATDELQSPVDQAEAWLEAARLWDTQENEYQARLALLQVLTVAPASPWATRALNLLPSVEELPAGWEGQLLRAARATRNHARLVELLPRAIALADARSPGEPISPAPQAVDLRLELGEALLATGAAGKALEWLAPLGDTPVEVELLRGQAQVAQGHIREGAATLLRVAALNTHRPDIAGRALMDVAALDAERGDQSRATQGFQQAYALGFHDPEAEVTAVRTGARHYLLGELDPASSLFATVARDHPRSASRQLGAFWAALVLEADGKPGEAMTYLRQAHDSDPLSYYGLLAGERLGEAVLPTSLPLGPEPRSDLEPLLSNALFRLRVHQRVPTPGSLAFELERLETFFTSLPGGDYAWAEALIQGGFPLQGVVLGRAIHSREGSWNLRLLRIVHPFPHREIIVREARARGLDPFLVAGLIRQESLFHASIRSSAGAVGLMQIMPATGAQVARGMGMSGFTAARLEEPEVNIPIGTRFLSDLLRRFDGQVTDALAAYNAGPTRARNWRRMDEYRNLDVFHEHIPFRETRHYVKVVQQYSRVYAALYGCPNFTPCLGQTYAALTSATRLPSPADRATPVR